MNRTEAREAALQMIFEMGFGAQADEILTSRLNADTFEALSDECKLYAILPDKKQEEYIRSIVSGVDIHEVDLNHYIEKYAKDWGLHRISRMALAILRLCMFELLYLREEIPAKAAINEAVELCKRYDGAEASKFVNGILGSFARGEVSGGE